MKLTYKYRAYPKDSAEVNSRRWLWKCWQLYNIALAHRIMTYQVTGKSPSAYDQYDLIRRKPIWSGLEWLNLQEVNIQVLQDVLQRLHLAYQHFFRRVKDGSETRQINETQTNQD